MDLTLARRKSKKHRAPPPPNPFTGEVMTDGPSTQRVNPFDEDNLEMGDDEVSTSYRWEMMMLL